MSVNSVNVAVRLKNLQSCSQHENVTKISRKSGSEFA